MAKNILIFADGTGNEGGLLPDESRTNVYKLFRATRTGPDSIIDPSKQLAFYVPGIGTPAPLHNSFWDRTEDAVRQMFGFGLTEKSSIAISRSSASGSPMTVFICSVSVEAPIPQGAFLTYWKFAVLFREAPRNCP